MQSEIEKYMVIITFISSFFSVFVINGMMVGIPEIAREFGMNNFVQNWIMNLSLLVVTMLTVPAGQITGKYGFKRSILIGNSIFLISLFMSAIAFSTEFFLFSRIIQGIGIAMVNVSEMAIVTLAISKENRGKALGIIVMGVYLGTSASPVISGFLIQHFGWRSVFFVSLPFIFSCIVMMKMKIKPEWKTNEFDRIDSIGIVLYMIGIALFIYGFTKLTVLSGQISALIGVIILAIYVRYELKQESPVFDVNMFRTKTFTAYNIAGLCGYFAVMVLSTIFNYYFQYVKGWDPQMTGLILIITPIVMSITAPNAGKLSDKIHPQKIAAVGMAITAVALIILSLLKTDTPLYVIIFAMALQAFGMGLFSSPNMNAIMSCVDEKDAAFASAGQLAVRAIGQTMSLGLMTLVFSWIMGHLPLNSHYAPMILEASNIVCAVCAVACVVAVIASVIGIKADKVLKR